MKVSNSSGMLLSRSDMEVLFLLEFDRSLSNVYISKILRRHASNIARTLHNLKSRKLVETDKDHKYKITRTGLDLVYFQVRTNAYFQELREFIIRLRKYGPENNSFL